KSRLVAEFGNVLDDRPDVVMWRQGRCLPYGEGIAYNALSEVVKAQAGILQAESPTAARAKLHDTVENVVGGDEAPWVCRALEALTGLEEDEVALQPEEAAAGWRRFIGALTDDSPLVLVIEDLHWADDGLLAFLNELPNWGFDLPLFLVCTARPEIYSERPEWAATTRNAIDVGLAPLGEDDIAGLLDELVDTSGLSTERHSELVARCGGNPLYAIEYASLVREGGGELAPPDSVQALIAARLDLLDSDTRLFLQAASVVGRVFWSQALMYMLSLEPDATDSAIRELRSRELAWPVRMPSMHGQTEFMFRHVLVRDVAYGQIPRADRARLHENVARWMEALSVENLAETAAQLAHHYSTAHELRKHLGEERPDLAEQAFRFTTLAAEQAANLDGRAALVLYQQAADTAPGKRSRADALVALARIQHDVAGSLELSIENSTEAAQLFEELGDLANQALALTQRSRSFWLSNDGSRADTDRKRAVVLIEDLPVSKSAAQALQMAATGWAVEGSDPDRAIELALRSLAMARQVGSPSDLAMALRVSGDAISIRDAERARGFYDEGLEIAAENGLTREEIYIRNNMHGHLIWLDGPLVTLDLIEGGIKLAGQRNIDNAELFLSVTRMENLLWLGRWNEALDEVEALIDRAANRSTMIVDMLQTWRALMQLMMGNVDEAPDALIDTQSRAVEVKDMQAVMPTTSFAIAASYLTGDRAGATALADQLFTYEGPVAAAFLAVNIWISADSLFELGYSEELEASLGAAENAQHRVTAAMARVGLGLIDLRRGDAERGLDRIQTGRGVLAATDFRLTDNAARIWEAEALWATGDKDGARAALAEAREFFEEIGARLYL
ncbi:MAG: AAA family ATPase, partial [Acidimicrobiia bacterium]|nr:AAA family ATPase [Acidimicrobiia bacterium]